VLFLAGFFWIRSPRRDDRAPLPAVTPPGWLDLLIAAGLTITWIATVSDRVRVAGISFAGPDVPAMATLGLVLFRFSPQLTASVRHSRFSTEVLAGWMWLVLGFVASLGWNSFFHPFLFRVISPFRATRTPARWAVIVYVGLAILAAAGAAALIEGAKPRWRRLVAGVLLSLSSVEVAALVRWVTIDPHVAPVYRWLAAARPGVVLELPVAHDGASFRYVLASTHHRVPILNGTSGWETPLHEMLRKKEEALSYDAQFYDAIRRAGCTTVIVHETALTEDQRRAVAPLLARMELRERFGSDAVYALGD
jgi:hypothetical protein